MNSYRCDISDFLSLFEESLSPADVLSSKLMAQVSTAITNERIRLKMSQKEFAKHIEASQSLVSRWEHGDYNFSLRKLSEIAEKLNMDINISMTNFNVCKMYQSFGNYRTEATGLVKIYNGASVKRVHQEAYQAEPYNNIIDFSLKEEKRNDAVCKCV